jgi:hypothetical protein
MPNINKIAQSGVPFDPEDDPLTLEIFKNPHSDPHDFS